MYNMKTDRQISHESKQKTGSRHSYTPQMLIVLALPIYHCERNNVIPRLLSAFILGITIPSRSALLLETITANVTAKIAEREVVYISLNIDQGVCVLLYINNFDEQEQTFDRKSTVHYLLFPEKNGLV